MKEKFSSAEFENLAQLAQTVSAFKTRVAENRRDRFQKSQQYVEPNSSSSESKEEEVFATEWSRAKKTVHVPWVKKGSPEAKYDFDVSKVDQIFDLLLKEG